MRKRMNRLALLCGGVLFIGMVLFLPVLPWSARCRHVVNKIAAKAEMKVAAWRGTAPRLVTLSGKIVSQRQTVKGAEIEALDSTSGWAALADSQGQFTLPGVLWYPRASYTLVVSLNDYQRRRVQVDVPMQYPTDGMLNLGELEMADCCSVDANNLPGQNSVSFIDYDRTNRDYYQSLFDQLTAAKKSDEERLEAINHYVAGKLTTDENTDPVVPLHHMDDKSPRLVLENGARYCGKLALAFATLAEAGNYKTRVLDLIDAPEQPSAHMVVEVYYGDQWHLYDPVAGMAIRRPDGRVISYKEACFDSSANLPKALPAHLPVFAELHAERITRIYHSGLHHYYYLKP